VQNFIDRKKQHLLTDIIIITIAAVLCGIESYNDIEDFGVVREDWLKTFLELPNGIRSHDTFNCVFANMNPLKFEAYFRKWVDSILENHACQLRKYSIITDLAHIEDPKRWKNLSVLVKMESERCFKGTGKIEKSIRYYNLLMLLKF